MDFSLQTRQSYFHSTTSLGTNLPMFTNLGQSRWRLAAKRLFSLYLFIYIIYVYCTYWCIYIVRWNEPSDICWDFWFPTGFASTEFPFQFSLLLDYRMESLFCKLINLLITMRGVWKENSYLRTQSMRNLDEKCTSPPHLIWPFVKKEQVLVLYPHSFKR